MYSVFHFLDVFTLGVKALINKGKRERENYTNPKAVCRGWKPQARHPFLITRPEISNTSQSVVNNPPLSGWLSNFYSPKNTSLPF